MNENHIKTLRIENFKSIKEMDLECSRINVFVGKPNVGKSNVLEALGMYGLDKSNPQKFIRFEQVKNFFPFNDTKVDINVNSNLGNIEISFDREKSQYHFKRYSDDLEGSLIWENDGKVSSWGRNMSIKKVKKYSFKPYQEAHNSQELYLMPPHGNNLFTILETNSELREEVASAFSSYDLEFAMDTERNKLLIQRRINGLSYFIPFSLVADTLQRIIFHYAAIYSNENSVILFEEPESHSYPPYIADLSYKIIDSATNQFFITTHSPYLLNTLMENTPREDLSIFVATYKNYETHVQKLTDQDFSDIFNNGVDLFFNLRWFDDE